MGHLRGPTYQSTVPLPCPPPGQPTLAGCASDVSLHCQLWGLLLLQGGGHVPLQPPTGTRLWLGGSRVCRRGRRQRRSRSISTGDWPGSLNHSAVFVFGAPNAVPGAWKVLCAQQCLRSQRMIGGRFKMLMEGTTGRFAD